MLITLLFALATPAHAELIAHEWGTFTSLQGSNGVPIEDLEVEDDPLPSFVHSRREAAPVPAPPPAPHWPNPRTPRECGGGTCKGMEFETGAGTDFAVTQKMETPVLYFHSDRAQRVTVDVGFPGGILGEYYPAPTQVSPPVGEAQSLANGHARFEVDILDGEHPLPYVAPENVYAPSRQVEANTLRSTAGEYEKFIFYRGLGKFETCLQIHSVGEDLTLQNVCKTTLRATFLVYSDGARGSISALGEIAGQDFLKVSSKSVEAARQTDLTEAAFQSRAHRILTRALVQTGLYEDEAAAMTNTWKRSYFRTPGLRVLYILGNPETETLLPMTITPQPDEAVRTMVGRVEILTAQEETDYLEMVQTTPATQIAQKFGRFARAKVLRLLSLTTDTEQVGRLLQVYEALKAE